MGNMVNDTNTEVKNNFEYYSAIKEIIEKGKSQAVVHVNSILTHTYWGIGKLIQESILKGEKGKYGDSTVKDLGERLSIEYGSGFGYRNLLRMIKFYSCFPEKENMTTLSALFSWSHFVEFIKIDDPLKRDFYIGMCKNDGWSVRTLRERINSMMFERTAISKNPDEVIRRDIESLHRDRKMSTSMFLRDPYLLDFLELNHDFSERDLEEAILVELERFILEFGSDFAFMGRQKRIQVGGNDYYIDLLFYHRKLRRLVLIELKLGEFKPEYKGQVELYLKWLAKNEKQDFEEDPIAIILCASKDNEVVELMDLDKENIHISEYWLKLPPIEVLKEKLHKAIELGKARVEVE
ncbi:PDDEXK nuclease domain-containing protein [uncultured Ilyobacter sp.]|uniref:PDDEXK nuclease domain-containing protein n=1 Tax=uncultured Ilyobacter sp. TaxID=544433 RepID=UPI0029F4B734|nr:PDDEXK nuclease domain-containing protein [uncultured Ilyobacter sp.]